MFLLHKLKLRDVKESCVLTGPTIKSAKRYTFSIDGTQISLKVPKHNTSMPVEPLSPKKEYSIKGKYFKNLISIDDGLGGLPVVSRDVDFYGPILGGKLATLMITLTVVSPREKKQEISFFHPRVFELFVGKVLEYLYGVSKDGERVDWVAPVEWSALNSFDTVAARYKVEPTTARREELVRVELPITSNHLLSLSFKMFWYPAPEDKNKTPKQRREWLDRSNIHKLIDDIIDSLEVNLSVEAKQQQKEALKGLSDTSLVKDYPPIDFSGLKNEKVNPENVKITT